MHVVSGALALALGPLALYASRRRSPAARLTAAYHWAVLGVALSAMLLAVLDFSRLWWFIPIAVGSYGLALLGFVAGRRHGSGWLKLQAHGQGASYVALVTALLVVSVGSPLAWAAPTVVGLPLIARAARVRPLRRAALTPPAAAVLKSSRAPWPNARTSSSPTR